MKKPRSFWLMDIATVFNLRMKLLLRDRALLIVLIATLLVYFFLVRSLTTGAGDQSSLPLGVIDYDHSSSSRSLVKGLKQVETFRVLEQEELQLQELLADEMIIAIFVIEEGYEARIKAGSLTDCITMYYKKDNKAATILADIAAGEMLYDISFYKAYHYYENAKATEIKLTEQQYREYIEKLLAGSEDFDFAFDISYENNDMITVSETAISSTVLYNQFIIGILGIFIAFLVMFQMSQIVREKESGIDTRRNITGITSWKQDIGTMLSILFIAGAVGIIFTSMIFLQLEIRDWQLWLSSYTLLVLYILVVGAVLGLLTKLMKRMHFYQIFCCLLILFTGGLGFYKLLSGFYQGTLDQIIKFIPNNWFIQGFTDIIIYGSRGGYLKEGHKILLLMAMGLLFLVFSTDLIRELLNKKRIAGTGRD